MISINIYHMKIIMKKIIILALTIILAFMLVACSNKNENNDVNNQNSGDIQNEENNVNDQKEPSEQEEYTASGEDVDITVQRTENSYTVNVGNQYKMIFEFENDRISRYYLEYEFETEEEAIAAEESYNAKDNEAYGVKSVERNGNIVRVEADLEEYQDLTREQIEDSFNGLVK